MRVVRTRVFPVPAPARMRTGPSVVRTASACSSLSPFKYGGFDAAMLPFARSERGTEFEGALALFDDIYGFSQLSRYLDS